MIREKQEVNTQRRDQPPLNTPGIRQPGGNEQPNSPMLPADSPRWTRRACVYVDCLEQFKAFVDSLTFVRIFASGGAETSTPYLCNEMALRPSARPMRGGTRKEERGEMLDCF